ncbi:hypothetical protein IWX76_002648 [Pedobacter sp. CAN_A7]|uniref:ABC transporter permease n=1 Tax=Pedobacter sp. CAN_A7 TaxID=2787722 RepID=UPI0018C930C0
MFKLNLKIAFRNLWKNKGYSFINILGLSIGMASCILIFTFVHYQTSFDEHFEHNDRIYRVVTNWDYQAGTGGTQGVPIAMLISMLVTLLTVSLRSYRAAVTNSINALKYE